MFDLDQLFQKSELIPVIIQHADTNEVLMLGFTNKEAVELTLKTKTAWFWSRSCGTRGLHREIFCTFSES